MAYFANSTEGDILNEQCGECPIGQIEDSMCPILHVQLTYNYDQCDKGQGKLKDAMNLLVNAKGKCQLFTILQELKLKETPKPNSPPSWLEEPTYDGP